MALMRANFQLSPRSAAQYYRMDAWDSGRQTNKMTEEQFKDWISEASKSRQEYTGLYSICVLLSNAHESYGSLGICAGVSFFETGMEIEYSSRLAPSFFVKI